MKSEIGGDFWINPYESFYKKTMGDPEQFNCMGSDYVWMSSGRAAIKFVLQTIEGYNFDVKKIAVLPSYTCDTVIKPFYELGYQVDYYDVDENLRNTSEDIYKKVIETDASIVLFHRYFGFDTLDSEIDKLCNTLRKQGRYSIEDCTQCLYSNIPRADTDFIIGSIRKWIGIPDGGFAVCRKGAFEKKPIKSDERLEHEKLKALYAKYRYVFENNGEKKEVLAMCRKAEDLIGCQTSPFAISPASIKVQTNLDKLFLINKRKENFKILSQFIDMKGRGMPLFSSLKDEIVPLYFPVLVEKRILLQKYLIQNAIYAPIVWPKNKRLSVLCNGAENAYNHLLCIPIDQRYDTDDMFRIVKVINNFYRI